MNRKKMIGYCIMIIIPTVFFLIVVALFSLPLMLLILMLLFLALGLLKRSKPELFSALKKENDGSMSIWPRPVEPPTHSSVNRTYLMLTGINVSNKHRITMDHSPFIIGRSDECNYVMNDPAISRQHMILEYNEETKLCYVKDVSANGVFLNSRKINRHQNYELKDGDILQIGSTALSVEYVHF